MSGGRLSLAYRDIEEVPASVLSKSGPTLKELDLSNNRLTEVAFARGLTVLETLVLDGNKLTHQVRFPPLPRLKTLWVNRNKIAILPTFIDRLAEAVPQLRFLSMLGNQACPNYLTGGTLKQYKDYRLFVISRLRQLEILDDAPVTEEERQEATRIYGSLDVSAAEAMYKQQTLDKGITEVEEQRRETAAKEQEATGSAGRRKEGAGRRKGTSKTPTKTKKKNNTAASNQTTPIAPTPPALPPRDESPSHGAMNNTESKASTNKKSTGSPAKQHGSAQAQLVPDDLPEISSRSAFGVAGLPPTAVALPSLAKKNMPPPPPSTNDDENGGEEDIDVPDFTDELPDPLAETSIPAVNAKPKSGRNKLPPLPSFGQEEEDDDSDWTEDDSEDEREVMALDLPDFSDSS